jgi:gamma-glutamylcyclotransferase
MSKPRPSPSKPKTLYFAYGSNLHLKQMARRCPNSKYVGRATLANYRWQINERGYANIVGAPGCNVQGLVYELDGEDEPRLDKNEGVSKGSYSKGYAPVTLYLPPRVLCRRPTAWIVQKGGPQKILNEAKQEGKDIREQSKCREPGVLIYISPVYVKEGRPHEEYIERINIGIKDATALGIDQDFFTKFVRRYVPEIQGIGVTQRSQDHGMSPSGAGCLTKAPQNHSGGKRKAPARPGEERGRRGNDGEVGEVFVNGRVSSASPQAGGVKGGESRRKKRPDIELEERSHGSHLVNVSLRKVIKANIVKLIP